MPRLLAFQRSNDRISLSVGIAGSLSLCCLQTPPAVFIACPCLANTMPGPGQNIPHAHPSCPLTLLPLSSPTVCCPTTPSWLLCCPYLLLSRVLCCTDLNFRHVNFIRPTPAARRGLLLRFHLRHFKFMRPILAARRGLLLLLLLFITHLVSMPSHRNVDLHTTDEYGDLLYDGIDKTAHGAPQLLRLILDELTLRGQGSTIHQPLRPASHTISVSDIDTVKYCRDGDCGWHSLLNERNRHFGQVCIHIRYIPFITTVTNSYLPVYANRLYWMLHPHIRIAVPTFVLITLPQRWQRLLYCMLHSPVRTAVLSGFPVSSSPYFTTACCAILPPHYLYNNLQPVIRIRPHLPLWYSSLPVYWKYPPPPFVQQCSAHFPSPPRHFTTALSRPIVLLLLVLLHRNWINIGKVRAFACTFRKIPPGTFPPGVFFHFF